MKIRSAGMTPINTTIEVLDHETQSAWQTIAIAQRLYQHLAHRPYCGQNKDAALIREKALAIKYPYIVLNQPTQMYWLTFDLDHENTFIWQDKGLPCPNFIVRDPHTGRGHITYAIEAVCTSDQARLAPQKYLNAIRRTMTRLLEADSAYNNRVTKNPFHTQWITTWLHDKVYNLNTLHEFLPQLDQPTYFEADELLDDSRRNCSVFNCTRFWAYKAVSDYREQHNVTAWQEAVLSKALSYASQVRCPQRGCLDPNEVACIARSIAKWCWAHYQGNATLTGKMQLDRSLPLRERQRLAAQHTNKQRLQRSESAIKAAIQQLKACDQKITKTAVARLSGLSRQYITREYTHLFDTAACHRDTPLRHTQNETVMHTQLPTVNTEGIAEKSVNYALHQVTAVFKKPLQQKNNNERQHDDHSQTQAIHTHATHKTNSLDQTLDNSHDDSNNTLLNNNGNNTPNASINSGVDINVNYAQTETVNYTVIQTDSPIPTAHNDNSQYQHDNYAVDKNVNYAAPQAKPLDKQPKSGNYTPQQNDHYAIETHQNLAQTNEIQASDKDALDMAIDDVFAEYERLKAHRKDDCSLFYAETISEHYIQAQLDRDAQYSAKLQQERKINEELSNADSEAILQANDPKALARLSDKLWQYPNSMGIPPPFAQHLCQQLARCLLEEELTLKHHYEIVIALVKRAHHAKDDNTLQRWRPYIQAIARRLRQENTCHHTHMTNSK